MQQLNILDDIEKNEVIEELDLENSDWKEYNLGDLVTLNYGKALPERDRIKGNIPVYSSSGITGWHNKFLTEEKSIIVGRKGSVGTVFYSDQPFFCIDTAYYITENKENYNLKYLYYLLKTLSLNSLNEDSAVPGLNRNTAYAQKFMLAPLKQQEQIAKILSSLDDKIELNQKMNKTLEEMAQAIFKHWFIDFENNNNEDFIRITEYIDLNPRLSIKANSETKYVEMKDLPTNQMSISNFIFRPFTSGSKFQNNDTLLARITPCLENGKTGFVDFLNDNEVAFGSTEFIVMRGKNEISPYFVYCLSRDPNFRAHAVNSMVGSSGRQRVQNDMLSKFELPKINNEKMKEYNSLMKPIFSKIRINTKQIIELTKIRDSLLPKLMSGEIKTNSSPSPFSSAFKGSKEGGQES